VSESADQLRRHIEILSEFEQKYDEFLIARHNRREIPEVQWSNEEWAARERELRMLAPRADAAMEASGVGALALYYPPALGGRLKADDLPSLIFDFKDFAGFSVDATDDEFQQAILDRIPSQLAGLGMKLEEAESAPQKVAAPVASMKAPRRWAWLNHPWTVAVGSGIILLILAAAAAALLH
jgi:hypothetical protein